MSGENPDDTRSQPAAFAAMWSSDGVTRSLAPTAVGLPADLPFLFSAAQRFGPYLIVRPIGKGGMGQVYEAEETDSGRRVALKILSRGIGDDEDRERFLREGQLAASLSHPNCVYVFGTTEIQGFPVIAMELAPGGTLKDLVVPGTPMTASQAVDAILQVIAGLEAAASIGILHRDVKPSNCFVDLNGRVLVGDFGLSIATLAPAGSAETGTILGTPGFASPEQLRGDALDVRSDIYSVGATVYYLLTGKAPFDDPDIRTMMTRVATETAPAVSVSRPDIPGRLGAGVAKCLATRSADRYTTYAALAAALEPFRTSDLTPASLGRRFMAGFIDSYAATLPLMPFNMFMSARIMSLENRGDAMLVALPSFLSMLAYYSVFEGRFGCGLGKAILNLRVVDAARTSPGMRRAFVRALVFMLPSQIATQILAFAVMRWMGEGARGDGASLAMPLMGLGSVFLSFACLAALFSTARRRNGYQAVHDRASGTRVVLRPKAIEARQGSHRAASSLDIGQSLTSRIGPYLVTDTVKALASSTASPAVVEGYDDRLQRRVWIELLPPGTPPLPSWRRDLGRPGRARWLSGRRAGTECWDAYEAFDGQSLLSTIAAAQPWVRVRHWLADLAHEAAAALKDGSLPTLRSDRIWITSDDRARLLDWPPPPASPAQTVRASAEPRPSGHTADAAAVQRFLYGVATGALRGADPEIAAEQPPSLPLPAPARALLLSLRDGNAGAPESIEARATAMLREAAAFPRGKRLIQLAVCSIVPVTIALAVFVTIKMQVRSQTADPPAFKLRSCLQRLVMLDKKQAPTDKDREERELIEIYVAEHLREEAQDKTAYARAFPAVSSVQQEYRVAARALANHPQRSADQIAKADAVVAKLLVSESQGLAAMNRPVVLWTVLALVAGAGAAFVAALGLIGAFAARGGFTLRAFGASLVTADGSESSRVRAAARALIAWSPVLLWYLLLKVTPQVRQATIGTALLFTLVVAILLAGAVWAWRHPSRGIQDRLAGTWIVPR